MKKAYKIPTLNVVVIKTQHLMTLSENNPQTQVNHTEYNDEFSSRGGSLWGDDE